MGLSHFRANHWGADHFVTLGARDTLEQVSGGPGNRFLLSELDTIDDDDLLDVLMLFVKHDLWRY